MVSQILSQDPSPDPLLGKIVGMKENEIAFMDIKDKLMIPHFIPISEETDELVPVRVHSKTWPLLSDICLLSLVPS
jgi:hypothetical protein